MGRITDLKYINDQIRQTNKTGSYSSRIARYQAVNRFINALGTTRQVPAKWYALDKEHIIKVIGVWRRQDKKENTIEKYIAHLKSFLDVIGHRVPGLDNRSLGLKVATYQADYRINDDAIESIHDPLAKLILLLQIKFGLTFAEAIRFMPDIHANENGLWLTREITRNSLDRTIKYNNEEQRTIIQSLLTYLGSCTSALSRFGYSDVRLSYRIALKRVGLKSSVNYRAVYARNRFIELSQNMKKNLARELIIDEMGISPATLWRFLNESN